MFYHGDSNMTLTLFCGDSSITHLRLLSCKSVKFRLFLDTFEVRSPNPSMIISSIKHSVSIWVCVERKHQCMSVFGYVWNVNINVCGCGMQVSKSINYTHRGVCSLAYDNNRLSVK